MFFDDDNSVRPPEAGDAVLEARQLNHWLAGQSRHLTMPDLCTPDYSCCEPELLAPLEERELYVHARNASDTRTLTRMDCMFLGRLIVRKGMKV